MNPVLFVGSDAVGKMTVGRELMKITDYRLRDPKGHNIGPIF